MSKQNTDTYTLDILLEVTDWLCTYYGIFLIIAGCVCNPLSFLVFSRKTFRDTTISVYLRILSVSDLCAILNGLLPYFLTRTFGVDPRINYVSCTVSMFVYFLALYISSWTLVAVTCERVISIIWPHKVHIFCSLSKVKFIVLSSFVCLGLLSLPYPLILYKDLELFNDVTNSTEIIHCAAVYKVEDVLPLLIVDAIMFAFLPSLLLIIFNIIIVIGVINSRKKIMKPPSGTSTRGLWPPSCCQCKPSSNRDKWAKQSSEYSKNSGQASKRRSKETSLTFTLLIISTTFILCNSPATAWGFGPQFESDDSMGPLGYAITDLLLILMYTNNSLNFLLYCLTGSKFRSEVRALFKEVTRCSFIIGR